MPYLAWATAEAHENIEAFPAKLGHGAKSILVRDVVADEDGPPAAERPEIHQSFDRSRFGNRARPNFEGHLSVQNFEFLFATLDQGQAEAPAEIFSLRGSAVVCDNAVTLALYENSSFAGCRARQGSDPFGRHFRVDLVVLPARQADHRAVLASRGKAQRSQQ